jgi:hypothetical protein
MARLSVYLMGPFRAALDGEPLTGFVSDKARALLAYLAVEARQPHRRQVLAGLLWGDYPERSARASLRNVLANLRHVTGDREAVPPLLCISPQAIQLNPEGDTWVDMRAFVQSLEGHDDNQAAGERGTHRLETAVSIYRGDFLEGFSRPTARPLRTGRWWCGSSSDAGCWRRCRVWPGTMNAVATGSWRSSTLGDRWKSNPTPRPPSGS